MSCAVRSIYRSLTRLGYAAPSGAAHEYQVLARLAMAETGGGCECPPRPLGRGLRFGGGGQGLHRLGEQISLHTHRSALRKEFELRRSLDSLGHHLQAK